MKRPNHILVAEDDDDDFFLVARELRKCGLTRVSRVADGKAVLDYLAGVGEYADRERNPMPEVVFLDLKLPVLLGHEVLSAIRRHPEWQGIKVYVLTGSDEHRDRERIREIGCAGYFVKPLTSAQVLELFPAD
jgi:CheY-like chemotaxis protein